MPRKPITKRTISADAVYQDLLVAKFINILTKKGKKGIAQKIIYQVLQNVKKRITDVTEVEVLRIAVENVKPRIEVKSRRVGGSTYQIPVEVGASRGTVLAVRWIIEAAKARKKAAMSEKLVVEVMEAYNKRGSAAKKKEDTHKMAESNRAFAHYIW